MIPAAPRKAIPGRPLFLATLIVVTLALVALAGFPSDTRAEPEYAIQATPVADAFAHASLGAFDNTELFTSTAGFPTSGPSAYAVLKFDLNTATSSQVIERARLNVTAIACGGDGTGNVTVWGLNNTIDGWTEGTLPSFTTIGAAKVSSLKSVDEGTVNGPGDAEVGNYYHWTDSDTGTSGLAEWLETQRSTGDGIATLMLQLEGTSDNAITFGDRELTAGPGCETSQGAPILELSGAGDPLSVTLSTFHATDPTPVNWSVYVLGAVAAVLAAGALAFVLRRRTA